MFVSALLIPGGVSVYDSASFRNARRRCDLREREGELRRNLALKPGLVALAAMLASPVPTTAM